MSCSNDSKTSLVAFSIIRVKDNRVWKVRTVVNDANHVEDKEASVNATHIDLVAPVRITKSKK